MNSLLFGGIAAFLFIIPTFFYIRSGNYEDSWLMYLGGSFFFLVIAAHILFFNQGRKGDANTTTMVFISHVTTLIGVVISAILCFLLLVIMVPGYLEAGPAEKVATGTPINVVHDKTNGLSFRSFIGATLINFAFGSTAGILFPFYAKRNQTKESGEPYPLDDKKGVKPHL